MKKLKGTITKHKTTRPEKSKCVHDITRPTSTIKLLERRVMVCPEERLGVCTECKRCYKILVKDGKYFLQEEVGADGDF